MTDFSTSFALVSLTGSSRPILRDTIFALLGVGTGSSTEGIDRLADTFARFASTHQTAFDDGARPAAGINNGAGGMLERQVERAFTQVLGRAPGRNTDSFFGALGDTFPIGKDGTVVFTPTRSVVSLYARDGSMIDSSGAISAGLSGQISAEQAALYRQASVVTSDALRVLRSLQPFKPIADLDEVEALRALVETEIRSLVDEFGRLDRPRPDRVEALFVSLLGPTGTTFSSELAFDNGHLMMLGRAALLDQPNMVIATTPADEAQQTNFELLRQYALTLRSMWNNYQPDDNVLDFSTRLEKASLMLPVVAEANNQFIAALDAIGFGEQERRSLAANFRDSLRNPPATLNSGTLADLGPDIVTKLTPPDMTIYDLNEWIDRFTAVESPGILADSGQFGLDYVADQSDALFTMLASILLWARSNDPAIDLLARLLVHERVNWALTDLILQMKGLADAAEGTNITNGGS
jgi:hypothetical protein